jgi:hypothetical protein
MSDEINKLKIISDGTCSGTKVIDSNGNVLDGITGIKVWFDGDKHEVKAIIEVVGIEVESFIKTNNIEVKEIAK